MLLRILSVAALGTLAVASAHAGFVYGLSTGLDSGIFKIDTASGASTRVHTLSHAGAANNRDTNALAFDAATGNFYYRSSEGKLYRRNSSGETLVGTLSKKATSATFSNGAYYYIEEGTKNLRKVNVATFSDSVLGVPNGLKAAGYGDIASTTGGTFYGASDQGFYKSSLTNLGATTTYGTHNPGNLQLGFYGSALYGIGTDNDKIYSMNLATGQSTYLSGLQNANRMFITDAASAEAVPEPASLAALALGAGALLRRRRKSA